MPFLTPQYYGKKEGKEYLLSLAITWEDDYMKQGQENAKQYSEEHAQKRYLEGWKRAFEENTNSTQED